MNLISVVSLGINLGILSNYKKEALILLWRSMHVDMLREFCGKDFDSSEENRVRADIVRSHFSEFEDCFAFQKEDVHVS